MHDGKLRILIADDHTILRDGLKHLLGADPRLRVVGEARDGDEAVKLVAELRPDILLLDLCMPRASGMDALRRLARNPGPTRVIILAAEIPKGQIAEALQLGARGIVSKETAAATLLEAIHVVAGGKFWVGREAVVDISKGIAALERSTGTDERPKNFGLTARELEIVAAVVGGHSNREIARKLSISEQTVKHHLTNVFDKVGVFNRLELALFAINHHLIRD
jgi:DNA-binding NarL/FixJ family response regulator